MSKSEKESKKSKKSEKQKERGPTTPGGLGEIIIWHPNMTTGVADQSKKKASRDGADPTIVEKFAAFFASIRASSYNSAEGTIFGRTPLGWLLIILYLVVFYIVILVCLTGMCLNLLYLLSPDDKPMLTTDSGIIGSVPGMHYIPSPEHVRHIKDFASDFDDNTIVLEKMSTIYSVSYFDSIDVVDKNKINDENLYSRLDYQKKMYEIYTSKDDDIINSKMDCKNGYFIGNPCFLVRLNVIYDWKVPKGPSKSLCKKFYDKINERVHPQKSVCDELHLASANEKQDIYIRCNEQHMLDRKERRIKFRYHSEKISYKYSGANYTGFKLGQIRYDLAQVLVQALTVDDNGDDMPLPCNTWVTVQCRLMNLFANENLTPENHFDDKTLIGFVNIELFNQCFERNLTDIFDKNNTLTNSTF